MDPPSSWDALRKQVWFFFFFLSLCLVPRKTQENEMKSCLFRFFPLDGLEILFCRGPNWARILLYLHASNENCQEIKKWGSKQILRNSICLLDDLSRDAVFVLEFRLLGNVGHPDLFLWNEYIVYCVFLLSSLGFMKLLICSCHCRILLIWFIYLPSSVWSLNDPWFVGLPEIIEHKMKDNIPQRGVMKLKKTRN